MWQRRNRRVIPLDEVEQLPAYASLAVEEWRRRERAAEIRQAVDALPEQSRLIVTLHYLSGHSHREIGHFLGITAKAVSQHLYRARWQLKEMRMAEIEEGYTMNQLTDDFAQTRGKKSQVSFWITLGFPEACARGPEQPPVPERGTLREGKLTALELCRASGVPTPDDVPGQLRGASASRDI